jgi:5-(carboxyamino)imidazole ribonucleotide mutase
MDALLSTVQMPSGVPVATMAVNGAKNAAILAVEIFSVADAALQQKLADYREEMVQGVEKKAARVAAQL